MDGRSGLETMKRVKKMPLVKRQLSQTQDRRVILEETEEETDSFSTHLKPSDSIVSLKSSDTEGSSRPPTPGSALATPLLEETPHEAVSRKVSYRLSTLPPIPDDFMTSLDVNKPQETKVKKDTKTSSPRLPVGNFVKKGNNISEMRKSFYFHVL